MENIYITSALRTAVGSIGKSLKNISADKLGSEVILKNIEDSFASAANYLKKIGWDKNPWGVKVKLSKNIDAKNFTYDARKLAKQLKVKEWVQMGVKLPENFIINPNTNKNLFKDLELLLS
mgnify:CR=1 FL=1